MPMDPKIVEALERRRKRGMFDDDPIAALQSLGAETVGLDPTNPAAAPLWPCPMCKQPLPDITGQKMGTKVACTGCGWSRKLGR